MYTAPGQPLTVTQVNQYLKKSMDTDPNLSSILISGEISNYKKYPSGHHYFSLKDKESTLRCVLFRREGDRLRFRPEQGMEVLASGHISVFPRDGQYQLYCQSLTPNGVGDLYVAFEQLKAKLQAEGLFAQSHKKPLPKFPLRIALVTSSAGAAVQDMVRVLGARWPMAQVTILPVRVQGTEAPGEIAAALKYAGDNQVADLIITGRGGGSMEDLWAFNEEQVARAIYHCPIPIISAVGHEPDVTIADFVADVRGATPSHAAELAVPDYREVQAGLHQLGLRLTRAGSQTIAQRRHLLERLKSTRALRDPLLSVEERRMTLDHWSKRMSHGLTLALGREQARFARLAGLLDALSPLKVLARGYGLTTGARGEVISSVRQVELGQSLQLRLADGSLNCRIEDIHKGETEQGINGGANHG